MAPVLANVNGSEKGAGPLHISIAMATYNGAKFIREQLDSLARQSYLPSELVVTDDGSTDETLMILEEFGKTAPFPVRVYRNEERLGYAENFLKAASLCSGELISYCDQDDLWAEEKLQRCAAYFQDPEVMLTIHSALVLNGRDEQPALSPRFAKTQVFSSRRATPFTFTPGFSIVFRASILRLAKASDRPKSLHNHDEWVWLLATSIGRVVTIAEPLAQYRQHGNNSIGAPRKWTLMRRITDSSSAADYRALAVREEECAAYLGTLAAEHQNPMKSRLEKAQARLAWQARLHRLREGLYGHSGIGRRCAGFLRILALGGYFFHRNRTKIGMSGLAKDMFLGVTGIGSRPS